MKSYNALCLQSLESRFYYVSLRVFIISIQSYIFCFPSTAQFQDLEDYKIVLCNS